MAVPKTAALPLGYTPTRRHMCICIGNLARACCLCRIRRTKVDTLYKKMIGRARCKRGFSYGFYFNIILRQSLVKQMIGAIAVPASSGRGRRVPACAAVNICCAGVSGAVRRPENLIGFAPCINTVQMRSGGDFPLQCLHTNERRDPR